MWSTYWKPLTLCTKVTLPMAKPRLDSERPLTPAEKQARHRQKKEAEADRRLGLLYALEKAVWDAAEQGDALADVVKARDVETMLSNLTHHFEAVQGNSHKEE